MASPPRVKYKIVKCTSEDPEYPVSELLAHSSQTKGWQTARFCEFPQEIGVQFESPVHLRQVQFLSHQSKIATKIELFTAPASGPNARYETAQFKRLGYLSLDSNERSQFQARELKSVYVDVQAMFLKVVLHKCHVNRYNIVNQVGLIALHCSGEIVAPDIAGPPPSVSNYSRQSLSDNNVDQSAPAPAAPVAPALRTAVPARAAPAPVAESPPQSPPHTQEFESEYDDPPPQQQQQRAPVVPPPRQQQRAPAEPQRREQPRQAAPAQAPVQEAAQAPWMSGPTGSAGIPEESQYDKGTAERIRALAAAKLKAVESEDYEEAKRCKQMIDRLRETGQLLKELEDKKIVAVQNEDYDGASALKTEIDRVRASAEGREPTSNRARPSVAERPPVDSVPQRTAPRGGHQPVMEQAYDSGGGAGPRGSPMGSQGRLAAAAPEAPDLFGRSDGAFGFGGDGTSSRGSKGGASPKFSPTYDEPPDAAPAPPMPFNGGGNGRAMRGGSPPLKGGGGGMAAEQEEDDGGGAYDGGDNYGREAGAGTSDASYHLRGVPNVEDILVTPEALTSTLQNDKECMLLLQLFGDYIARCIYSKHWQLRDAALQKLTIDLRDGAQSGEEPNQLLQGYAMILKRTIADKNVQVSLSSGALQQAMAQVLLQSGHIRQNEAKAALDPIMPLLADRLGDANTRVDRTARDALLDFARCQHLGASFVSQHVLRPPKKKTAAQPHARVFTSRLQVLTPLATDFGVQPDSRDGVPLEATVKLAMESFTHKDGDVRENSVKLVAACFMHVGIRRIEGYLANLRPAQREVFDTEFDRVSGTPNGQGAALRASPSTRVAPGRLDDGYGDGYGGMPSPAVAPARRGSGSVGGGGMAASGGYQQEEEANYEEQDAHDFTCQFCERQDPGFTHDALDVHYWRECPMLVQCDFCQQVIEISTLRSHLCEECESGAPAHTLGRSLGPRQCPLCSANVGQCEERDWKEHLLSMSCTGNRRTAVHPGSFPGR